MASGHKSRATTLSAAEQERVDQAADVLGSSFGDVPLDDVSDWQWAAEAARVLKAALVAAGLHESAGLVGRIAPTVWVQPLDPADARALAALIDRALLAVGGWPGAGPTAESKPGITGIPSRNGRTQHARTCGAVPDVEQLRAAFGELLASVVPRDCAAAVDALLQGPFPPLSRMTGPSRAHRRALQACAVTASGRRRWITRVAGRRPPRFVEPARAAVPGAHTPVEERR
jgi:hypothetical protein